VAMVLTLSRAGYGAMAVLVAVLVLSVPSRRLRLGVVGVLALAVLGVLELPFINQRLSTLSHSVPLRLSIYTRLWACSRSVQFSAPASAAFRFESRLSGQ